MPPRSTNAPKSAMFLTTPLRTWPGWISPRRCFFSSSRCSSMSLRREMTMFIRGSSILMIRASMSLPMNSPMSFVRRIATWLAGRKTGTPMSTSRPPLIFLSTRPRTVSPSLWDWTMRSQPRMRSALRLERTMPPPPSSTDSRSTSMMSPTSNSVASENSDREMTPSDL